MSGFDRRRDRAQATKRESPSSPTGASIYLQALSRANQPRVPQYPFLAMLEILDVGPEGQPGTPERILKRGSCAPNCQFFPRCNRYWTAGNPVGRISGANGRLLCSFMPENALIPDERLDGDLPSLHSSGVAAVRGNRTASARPCLTGLRHGASAYPRFTLPGRNWHDALFSTSELLGAMSSRKPAFQLPQ